MSSAAIVDLEIGRERARIRSGSGRGPSRPAGPGAGPPDRSSRRRARTLVGRPSPTAGSARFPAVARMLASGVRRSCDTESSSALLSASLRRATSARHRVLAQAVAAEAEGDLVGGQGEQPGRLRVRRPAAARRSSPRADPKTVPPVSILIRTTSPSARSWAWRDLVAGPPCARTQRAGSSPGVRTSVVTIAAAGRGRTRCRRGRCSLAAGSRPIQTRSSGRRGPAARRSRRPPPPSLGGREQPADGELPGRLGRSSIGLGRALAARGRPGARRRAPRSARGRG